MKKSIKQMHSSLLGLLSVRFLSNQKLLILLVALFAAVSAHAYDFKIDGIYYEVISSTDNTKQVSVTYKEPLTPDYTECVTIPTSVEYDDVSYDVTSIGDRAFYYCSGLTLVSIPTSVTSIGSHAFEECDNLTSVTIPNSVTSIGNDAFSGCHNLKSVNIPSSVTSISDALFHYCYNLSSVDIPNSVTSIGNEAFRDCYGLTLVTIPNSVTSIGNNAFNTCRSLTSVTIPNSVTSIGQGAFTDCQSLASVTIPNSVTSIGQGAFSGCSGLISVTIPNTITSIEDYTFSGCSGLTSVDIPGSVTSIGNSAFFGCSGLKSITIPNSVISIGASAFSECSGLISVNLATSVTSIGDGAFSLCSGLTSMTVKNGNPSNITVGYEVFNRSSVGSATLYVPIGSTELYANKSPWNEFGNIKEISINLVDGQPYTRTSDMDGIDITYTRTFAADIWQPLYVPFNMSYDEWKDYGRVAELSCVHAYEDGRTTIEFVSVNSGELLPNVPYVFLPNAGGETVFTCTNKTLKAAPAEGTKYIMCSSPRYTFKIYGNYQPISGSTLATYGDPQFNGAYVMTSDRKFQHCSTSSTLKPYRFYITREKSANGYWGAPARQNAPAEGEDDDVIYFMVDGEVCGIIDFATDTDGNGTIYDLMGREVKNPSNGIYIQNGKKIRIY